MESVIELARQPLWVAGAMSVGAALVLLLAIFIAMRVWGGPSVRAPRERAAAQPAGVHRPGVRGGDPTALYREAQRLTAHAVAARDRATAARDKAAAARQRQAAAETIREDAWKVYSTVESPVVVPASGADAAATPPKELTHAAFVAFREGAITVEQLQKVWGGSDDPSADQQRRAASEQATRQREARREFERAVAEERVAIEEARVAEVAAEALAAEADEAEREALAAREVAQRYLDLGGPGEAGASADDRAGRGRPGRGATGR